MEEYIDVGRDDCKKLYSEKRQVALSVDLQHRYPKLSVSMANKNIRICMPMGIPIESLRR